jgi:hypothetical protein
MGYLRTDRTNRGTYNASEVKRLSVIRNLYYDVTEIEWNIEQGKLDLN